MQKQHFDRVFDWGGEYMQVQADDGKSYYVSAIEVGGRLLLASADLKGVLMGKPGKNDIVAISEKLTKHVEDITAGELQNGQPGFVVSFDDGSSMRLTVTDGTPVTEDPSATQAFGFADGNTGDANWRKFSKKTWTPPKR